MTLRRTIEGSLQNVGLQNIPRTALAQFMARFQQQNGRERAFNELQIMHRSKDGNSLFTQCFNQAEQFQLAAQVETLSGFVEQEQARFLGQSQSNFDALAFSSTQFVENPIPERSDVG